MRLKERTLMQVQLAPRLTGRGALGGVAEGYSDETISLRASLLPEGGALEADARGAKHGRKLRLLVARDASAAVGDGVWVEDRLYRITAIERWWAHAELICEAIA